MYIYWATSFNYNKALNMLMYFNTITFDKGHPFFLENVLFLCICIYIMVGG